MDATSAKVQGISAGFVFSLHLMPMRKARVTPLPSSDWESTSPCNQYSPQAPDALCKSSARTRTAFTVEDLAAHLDSQALKEISCRPLPMERRATRAHGALPPFAGHHLPSRPQGQDQRASTRIAETCAEEGLPSRCCAMRQSAIVSAVPTPTFPLNPHHLLTPSRLALEDWQTLEGLQRDHDDGLLCQKLGMEALALRPRRLPQSAFSSSSGSEAAEEEGETNTSTWASVGSSRSWRQRLSCSGLQERIKASIGSLNRRSRSGGAVLRTHG